MFLPIDPDMVQRHGLQRKAKARRPGMDDMRMLRWMCGVTKTDNNQKRTREMLSKCGTSDKEDDRAKAILERTCQ